MDNLQLFCMKKRCVFYGVPHKYLLELSQKRMKGCSVPFSEALFIVCVLFLFYSTFIFIFILLLRVLLTPSKSDVDLIKLNLRRGALTTNGEFLLRFAHVSHTYVSLLVINRIVRRWWWTICLGISGRY